ncbi:MAG: hypothetical protein COT74_05885 [Bdellovibrionales bacterium CG10_big_fil_rev_8_21_14_0_10_45_34]|nr:MAG: hypothetical protein COT74_05885 [Bdellovibrionales bacterium CG10_big_fil_rev_8_21_14_0_10_45_34]
MLIQIHLAMRFLLVKLIWILLTCSIANAGDWTASARVLAGWDSTSSNTLISLKNGSRSLFAEKNFSAMEDFAAEHLPEGQQTRNLIYLFGGPDVLFPQVLFPNYEKLLLVGLEPPGDLPNLAQLEDVQIQQKISEIARAYRNSLNNSYFITSHMAKDLAELGTTTMIATGLVALGFELLDIEKVGLSVLGEVVSEPTTTGGSPVGVLVRFRRPNGSIAEVYYFRFDLSDGSLNARPHLREFITQKGFDSAFYKAASYVSSNINFGRINELVLNQAKLLVQADDGIPFDTIAKRASDWSLRLYGVYTKPHSMFGVKFQKSLQELFGHQICDAAPEEAQNLWFKLWNEEACDSKYESMFLNANWHGYLPFRFGYAAVSGPNIVNWNEKIKFGTLMVFSKP